MTTSVLSAHLNDTVLLIPKGSQIKLTVQNQSAEPVNEIRWALNEDQHVLYDVILPGQTRKVFWRFKEDKQEVDPSISFAYRKANLSTDAPLKVWNFRLETDKEAFLSSLVLTILSNTNTVCRVACYDSDTLVQEFFFKKNGQCSSSLSTPELTPTKSSPPFKL